MSSRCPARSSTQRFGHIDWSVVLAFGIASVPLSSAGARVALRTNPVHLERIYGAVLFVLGVGFLFVH